MMTPQFGAANLRELSLAYKKANQSGENQGIKLKDNRTGQEFTVYGQESDPGVPPMVRFFTENVPAEEFFGRLGTIERSGDYQAQWAPGKSLQEFNNSVSELSSGQLEAFFEIPELDILG